MIGLRHSDQSILHLGDAGVIHLRRGENSWLVYGEYASFGFCKPASWLAVVCDKKELA
jgi:hypothetical protein